MGISKDWSRCGLFPLHKGPALNGLLAVSFLKLGEVAVPSPEHTGAEGGQGDVCGLCWVSLRGLSNCNGRQASWGRTVLALNVEEAEVLFCWLLLV